jgi:hypothetical protein
MTQQRSGGVLPGVALAMVVLSSAIALTQKPDAAGDKASRIAALKQSLAQNQAALRQYSWIETTQVSLKGEVKKEEQKQCFYGADGKVQKTPIGAPAEKPKQEQAGGRRGGRVKQAIVENKVEDLKDYLEQVAALVKEYVPPEAPRIQAAEAAGNVSIQPAAQGLTSLAIKSYVKMGDALTLGFDPAAKKLRSYNVDSYVDKKDDAVTLGVTFASLDDGTNYPQQVLLNVKAKQLQVKITNSGYKKK